MSSLRWAAGSATPPVAASNNPSSTGRRACSNASRERSASRESSADKASRIASTCLRPAISSWRRASSVRACSTSATPARCSVSVRVPVAWSSAAWVLAAVAPGTTRTDSTPGTSTPVAPVIADDQVCPARRATGSAVDPQVEVGGGHQLQVRRGLLDGRRGPVDGGRGLFDGRHQLGGEGDRREFALQPLQLAVLPFDRRDPPGEPVGLFPVGQPLYGGVRRVDALLAGLDRRARLRRRSPRRPPASRSPVARSSAAASDSTVNRAMVAVRSSMSARSRRRSVSAASDAAWVVRAACGAHRRLIELFAQPRDGIGGCLGGGQSFSGERHFRLSGRAVRR